MLKCFLCRLRKCFLAEQSVTRRSACVQRLMSALGSGWMKWKVCRMCTWQTGAMKTAHSSKRIAVLREHVAILERNTEYSCENAAVGAGGRPRALSAPWPPARASASGGGMSWALCGARWAAGPGRWRLRAAGSVQPPGPGPGPDPDPCVFAGRGAASARPGPGGGWRSGGARRTRIRRTGGPSRSPPARPVRACGASAGLWGATTRSRGRRCCRSVCCARGCCSGACSGSKRRSMSGWKRFSSIRSRTR